MSKKRTEIDWYYVTTRGMGIIVCIASLALLIYLIKILSSQGLDLLLAGFFLVPIISFAVGIGFLKLSGLETIKPKERKNISKEFTVKQRIGIISDTHGLIRPEVAQILKDCDFIIHAGDIDRLSVMEELEELGTLYIVKGNTDKGTWAEELKEQIFVEIAGLRFLIVHNRQHAPKVLNQVDVVIFGHSHKYYHQDEAGILWLNPGSCGRRRFKLPVTMAVMEIGAEGIRVKQHLIEEGK